jgi:hypothetical protein
MTICQSMGKGIFVAWDNGTVVIVWDYGTYGTHGTYGYGTMGRGDCCVGDNGTMRLWHGTMGWGKC